MCCIRITRRLSQRGPDCLAATLEHQQHILFVLSVCQLVVLADQPSTYTYQVYPLTMPNSRMMTSAPFSPIIKAVLQVFAPTFLGTTLKSTTFTPRTP